MSASDASATNSDAAPTAGPKTGIMPLPSEKTHDMVYCCRKCRTPLFRPDAIGEHDVGKHHFSYLRTQKDREQGKGSRSFAGDGGAPTEPSCTSYFLKEALKWMESASSDVEGKLLCPHCSARVGTLNWSGAQCSCGTWVSPAIQVIKKSVDERFFPKRVPAAAAGAAAASAGSGSTSDAEAPSSDTAASAGTGAAAGAASAPATTVSAAAPATGGSAAARSSRAGSGSTVTGSGGAKASR